MLYIKLHQRMLKMANMSIPQLGNARAQDSLSSSLSLAEAETLSLSFSRYRAAQTWHLGHPHNTTCRSGEDLSPAPRLNSLCQVKPFQAEVDGYSSLMHNPIWQWQEQSQFQVQQEQLHKELCCSCSILWTSDPIDIFSYFSCPAPPTFFSWKTADLEKTLG